MCSSKLALPDLLISLMNNCYPTGRLSRIPLHVVKPTHI